MTTIKTTSTKSEKPLEESKGSSKATSHSNTLPEAPASVTYSVTSPNGHGALVTVRDEKMSDLMIKMERMEKWFGDKGYTPQKKGGSYQKPVDYVEGKSCPKCGGRLIKKTKKDGSPFHQCENRKWNATTKEATGCSFIDWLEDKNESFDDIPEDLGAKTENKKITFPLGVKEVCANCGAPAGKPHATGCPETAVIH